jgi:glycosyltransferase involved in cell wall biosynthesis
LWKSLIITIVSVRQVDVICLNIRIPFDLLYATILYPLCKLYDVKIIIRKFAGDFSTRYDSFPGLLRWLYNHILFKPSVLWLFETKALVLRFHGTIPNVKWFPTHHPLFAETHVYRQPRCRRFVYVGHVRAYKGILELVQAAEDLDGDISVDIYGPLFADLPEGIFDGCRKISYKGVLDHHDVLPTIKHYDALVLPTKAHTEGYPSVILEAYQAGLPVIAARCGGIPEIVDAASGILVEPGNVHELGLAMTRLSEDDELYSKLCKGAMQRVRQFSSELWGDQFVLYCRDMLKK